MSAHRKHDDREVVRLLSRSINMEESAIRNFLEALSDALLSALAVQGDVTLKNFLSFKVVEHKPRQTTDAKTGQVTLTPPHRSVSVAPDQAFLEKAEHKLETILTGQRRNFRILRERIQELPNVKLRRSHDPGGELGWTLDLLLPDTKVRDRFLGAMKAENVPMSAPSAATPLPPFPYIESKAAPHAAWPSFNSARGKEIRYGAQCCPRTLDFFNRAATLTVGPKYTDDDLNDIGRAITKVYKVLLA